MIDNIIIYFWSYGNYANMKYIRRRCNLTVYLSKFASNKNILSGDIILDYNHFYCQTLSSIISFYFRISIISSISKCRTKSHLIKILFWYHVLLTSIIWFYDRIIFVRLDRVNLWNNNFSYMIIWRKAVFITALIPSKRPRLHYHVHE